MERAGRALPVRRFSGKQWIGIDRRALPPTLALLHAVDREMEVGAAGFASPVLPTRRSGRRV